MKLLGVIALGLVIGLVLPSPGWAELVVGLAVSVTLAQVFGWELV